MIHRLIYHQSISRSIENVWEYFAKPQNLNELTPPNLAFEIINDVSHMMYPGQLIEYRIKFFPLIRSIWLTEIIQVKQLEYFIDEQRIGPYRYWSHEHRFQSNGKSTEMTDIVTYQMPYGLVGSLVHLIWIRNRLNQIFDFRKRKIESIFPAAG